jgi:hypothetical protein
MKKLIVLTVCLTLLKLTSFGYCTDTTKKDSICFSIKQASAIYTDLTTCKDSLTFYKKTSTHLPFVYCEIERKTCLDSLNRSFAYRQHLESNNIYLKQENTKQTAYKNLSILLNVILSVVLIIN